MGREQLDMGGEQLDMGGEQLDMGDEQLGRIEIVGLTKRFTTPEGTTVTAVDDLHLTIEPNEFFVMLGPSGCGKTTALRSIAGLEHPDSGTIHLDGQRIDTMPAYYRPVSTVFQSYALFPHMSVIDNVSFGLQQQKLPRAQVLQRAHEALGMVRLEGFDRRKPHQMSGGQQQRVALARCLAVRPKVLLLDEPLAALDLKLRREMQVELKRLQREAGITFVFVTHDQEEALALGDRIAVFRDGRMEQVGTPTEMYEEPSSAFVAGFLGETNVISSTIASNGAACLGIETVPLHGTLSPGPALVAIRPERLEVVQSDGHLIGTVTLRTYLGNEVRYAVACQHSDGSTIDVQVRQSLSSLIHDPAVGDHVHLRADERMVRFLRDAS
jgi:spermidine/putrescine transport system ATP-binding protein